MAAFDPSAPGRLGNPVSILALLPQPCLDGFRLETNQVAEFDAGHACVAHIRDMSRATSDVTAEFFNGPELFGFSKKCFRSILVVQC